MPFPTDRAAVHIDIAAQEMLRLRIEHFAQNFFDENLATAGCRDDPNQNAEHERDRPKPRAPS